MTPDRTWFRAHPTRRYRVRPSTAAESAYFGSHLPGMQPVTVAIVCGDRRYCRHRHLLIVGEVIDNDRAAWWALRYFDDVIHPWLLQGDQQAPVVTW